MAEVKVENLSKHRISRNQVKCSHHISVLLQLQLWGGIHQRIHGATITGSPRPVRVQRPKTYTCIRDSKTPLPLVINNQNIIKFK